MTFLNNIEFNLLQSIPASATTGQSFNISNDKETDTMIDTAGQTVSVVFKNTTQIERFRATFGLGKITIVSRGITQAQTLTTDMALQRQWDAGAKGVITTLASDMFDPKDNSTIAGNITLSGDTKVKKISFNDATEAGLQVNRLTTTQKNALAPSDGFIVFDTTLGDYYVRKSGNWEVLSTGVTVSNMSETVNGTGEISTPAERGAGTSLGGTGARLVVSNDALVKTSSGGSDNNKIPVLNSSGKLDLFISASSSGTSGIIPIATDGEAIAGSITNKAINPKQNGFNIVGGDTILASSDSASAGFINTSYIKYKEISVALAGTYRVYFSLYNQTTSGGMKSFGRIYVNGNAVGIEREGTGNPGTNVFIEDITVSSGDLIQVYGKIVGSTSGAISLFSVRYNTVSKLPTATVNI